MVKYKKPRKRKLDQVYCVDILKWHIEEYQQRVDRIVKAIVINNKPLARRDKVSFVCEKCGEYVELFSNKFARRDGEKLCRGCAITANHKRNPKWLVLSEEQKQKISERNSGFKIKKYEKRICPNCGKEFEVRLTAHNKEKIYCSKKCNIDNWGKFGKKHGSKNSKDGWTKISFEKKNLWKKNLAISMANISSETKEQMKIKSAETKRKNNTFNISFTEEKAYSVLSEIYDKVTRQYKDDRYPFNCDFYIPSEDLFLECNFHWTHGPAPFDENKKEHNSLKRAWENKSTSYYDNAIRTWTKRDVKKIDAAIDNDLNYSIIWDESIFELEDFNLIKVLISAFKLRECNFNEVILKKELLLSQTEHDLVKLLSIISKWLRLFHPEFYIDYDEQDVDTVIKKIQKKRDFWTNPNTSQTIGNYFLKNRFLSFWKARKKRISLHDAYYDDVILEKIIRYRIGLNAKRETFDISMKNIIKGYISGGYGVSWFSPVLACEIYKRFAPSGAKVMYDPCSGFGARALGWKAFGGTHYYGVDANPETVIENNKLLKEINLDGKVSCSRAEDFILKREVDFAMTCPPYFNGEEYSAGATVYTNIEELFLYPMIENTLKCCSNFVLVVNEKLKNMIENKYKIKEEVILKNTKSHLRKSSKNEYIILI